MDDVFQEFLYQITRSQLRLAVGLHRARSLPAGTCVEVLDIDTRETEDDLEVIAHVRGPNVDGDVVTLWVPATALAIGAGLLGEPVQGA